MMNAAHKPVRLVDLHPEAAREFLRSFDHVFSDCDGVIWMEKALPHVGEFFELIKECGKTLHFISNNSIRSQQEYESKFKEAGIEDGYNNLTVPSMAIAEYLKKKKLKKAVYSVSCEQTTKMLESKGFTCKTGPEVGSDNYEEYANYLEDDPEIGAVVFDSDYKANLAKLHKAITYLHRQDVLFACGATDKKTYFKKGVSGLGCSIFTDIAAVEAERVPAILSKPSKLFGDFAMKRLGIDDPSRVLFIGDTIDQDVAFGKACEFKTLMILTNIPENTMLAGKTIKPDYYADSLACLVPMIQDYVDYLEG